MRGLLLVLTLHRGDHDRGDRWFAADKVKHFVMAAFVETGSFSALRLTGMHRTPALNTAIGVAAGISVGKEVYDRFNGGDASLKDLTWDAAGIAAGAVAMHQTKP